MTTLSNRELTEEVERLRHERLALQDRLDDVMQGFGMWRKAKLVNLKEWTTLDEAFVRWVEAGRP